MRLATAQDILALELLGVELELARAESVAHAGSLGSPGSAPRDDGTTITRRDRYVLSPVTDVVEDRSSSDRRDSSDVEHAADRDFSAPLDVLVFERAPVAARAARGGDLRANR